MFLGFIPFLPPANEVWGKVIFSEACVKNSVHGGSTWSGTSGQVHPLGRYTPKDQVHPLGRYPPNRYTLRAVHAARYRQEAGDTHPTGMHSCSRFLLKFTAFQDYSRCTVIFQVFGSRVGALCVAKRLPVFVSTVILMVILDSKRKQCQKLIRHVSLWRLCCQNWKQNIFVDEPNCLMNFLVKGSSEET